MTYVVAHWPLLVAIFGPALGVLIATLASIYGDPDNDPATPPPTRFGVFILVVQRLFTLWAPPGYTGIGGTRLSLPLFHLPSVPANDKGRPPGASGTIAAAMLLPLLFAACLPAWSVCKPPLPITDPKCQLERNLVACGEQSGYKLLPIILSIIAQAIGGHFDPVYLADQLELQGFKDVPCILAAVESYLLPENPELASQVHKALVYSLAKKGMHGLVGVKLTSGKVVNVVLP